MLKKAECSCCNAALPLDCGFFQFKLAPRELTCWKCGARMPAPFRYRSKWLGFQFFRGSLFLLTGIGFSLAFFVPERFIGMAIFGTIFGAMTGMLVGTVLAGLVAPVLQIFVDIGQGMKQLQPCEEIDCEMPDPHLATSRTLQHPAVYHRQHRKAG